MGKPAEAKKSSLGFWAFTIVILALLCVWLSVMTAGLMAGACRNDHYEGARKLRFCDLSLTAGAWMNFSTLERAKRSRIELEKGIALSQIGELEQAVEAFEKALHDARAKSGSWEQELHQRMAQTDNRNTRALWVSVVEAVE